MNFVGVLPPFVRKKIEHRPGLKRILENIAWLVFDKAWRLGLGFVVAVWLARYLGAAQYGLWSYATALGAIFIGIATLGLDSIVIRDLVRHPEKTREILGSAFTLKLIGGVVALAAACLCVWLLRSGEADAFWLVTLISASSIFHAFNVIDFYFQSQVAAKYTVYSTNAAFTLMAALKIYFLLTAAPLMAFAWANLGEAALTAIFLALASHFKHLPLHHWRARLETITRMMRDGWPLLLAGMAVMVYMRVDAIMLQYMLDDHAVGIYSAATRLSEIWYMVPTVIVASVSPAIIQAHGEDSGLYLKRLRQLYSAMFWAAVLISTPISLFSSWIMDTLFGGEFLASGPVLAIHLWASIAVFLGVASSQYLVIEHLEKISFYRTLIGLICNILLNIGLIPTYGPVGAAIATVISYFVATFSLCLFRPTRSHTGLLVASPLLPK